MPFYVLAKVDTVFSQRNPDLPCAALGLTNLFHVVQTGEQFMELMKESEKQKEMQRELQDVQSQHTEPEVRCILFLFICLFFNQFFNHM